MQDYWSDAVLEVFPMNSKFDVTLGRDWCNQILRSCTVAADQHQQQQQQLTSVSLPVATDVGDATDPADLQCTGLPDEAATQAPLVHQCYDEVPSRQHAGLQLPDGNGALLNADPGTLCCLQHSIIECDLLDWVLGV